MKTFKKMSNKKEDVWFLSLSALSSQNGTTLPLVETMMNVSPCLHIHPDTRFVSSLYKWLNKTPQNCMKAPGCLEQTTTLFLRHKSLLWSLQHNTAVSPVPLGQATNNTHNGGCLTTGIPCGRTGPARRGLRQDARQKAVMPICGCPIWSYAFYSKSFFSSSPHWQWEMFSRRYLT